MYIWQLCEFWYICFYLPSTNPKWPNCKVATFKLCKLCTITARYPDENDWWSHPQRGWHRWLPNPNGVVSINHFHTYSVAYFENYSTVCYNLRLSGKIYCYMAFWAYFFLQQLHDFGSCHYGSRKGSKRGRQKVFGRNWFRSWRLPCWAHKGKGWTPL